MTPAKAASPNLSTPPVLLVDDEEIVRIALRDLLRQQGYSVVAAQDVVAALSQVQQQTFAVVITDQQMPQLSGLEFLAEVKRVQPACSRLLLSAELNLQTAIEAINQAEIYRFVIKPWHREDLLRNVRQAFDRFQAILAERRKLEESQATNADLIRQVQALEEQRKEAR